ncbi:MAG: class I SAM-dependent methyltransferase [Myxococcales bacterium]|nr:class I SAM-dependent methyltransferase [Myxococcales bacterium]
MAEVYGDHYFSGGQGGYPDYLRDGSMLRERGQMYADIVAGHTVAGRVVDIGCAAGFVLGGFIDRGWTGTGVEPNPQMAAYAQQRLGLDVVCAPVEMAEIPGPFNVVSMIQVLPHLIDPLGVVRSLVRRLPFGGLLLVETWDRNSTAARLWGQRWHEYDPPRVLHWFDRPGLADMMARVGLSRIDEGQPQRYITALHARSLMEHTLGSGMAAKALTAPLRLFPERFRLRYPMDDLFWMLFQKK